MTLFAIAALHDRMRCAGAAVGRGSVVRFRGTKIGVMPAKAGIHISAAPLYDTGFPLSRE
jgi:hypothetical protein